MSAPLPLVEKLPAAAASTMPTTSPAGWAQVYAEDFLTEVPLGGFLTDGRSNLLPTAAAYPAYHDSLKTYPDGHWDTAKKAMRYPSKTMSVSKGCLDIYLHTETINGAPTALAGSVLPLLQKGTHVSGQVYGRYSTRMRVVGEPDLRSAPKDYGGVWMLWQDSDTPKWPAQGEVDFPEGAYLGKMSAFAHYASPKRGQDAISTQANWVDWHTLTTEWLPGSLRFFVDGKLVGTSQKEVPSTSMHYMFQSGSSTSSPVVDPAARGHVQIDWIVIEKPVGDVASPSH